MTATYEELMDFVRWTRGFWCNGIRIMRENNLKIENLDDPIQKLAFTFYSDLCEIDMYAERLMEDES